jgi:hypothetical protein
MKIDTPEAAIQIAKKSCMTGPQDSNLVWSADYWLGMWHVQAIIPPDPKNVAYDAVVWRNGYEQSCAATIIHIVLPH